MIANSKKQPLLKDTSAKPYKSYLISFLFVFLLFIAFFSEQASNHAFFPQESLEKKIGGGSITKAAKAGFNAFFYPPCCDNTETHGPGDYNYVPFEGFDARSRILPADEPPAPSQGMEPPISRRPQPQVALCVLKPNSIDYTQNAFGKEGMTEKIVKQKILEEEGKLKSMGYNIDIIEIVPQTSPKMASYAFDFQRISSKVYYVILIDAAIRENPRLLPLFERLVNDARAASPQAMICFNNKAFEAASDVDRCYEQLLEEYGSYDYPLQ